MLSWTVDTLRCHWHAGRAVLAELLAPWDLAHLSCPGRAHHAHESLLPEASEIESSGESHTSERKRKRNAPLFLFDPLGTTTVRQLVGAHVLWQLAWSSSSSSSSSSPGSLDRSHILGNCSFRTLLSMQFILGHCAQVCLPSLSPRSIVDLLDAVLPYSLPERPSTRTDDAAFLDCCSTSSPPKAPAMKRSPKVLDGLAHSGLEWKHATADDYWLIGNVKVSDSSDEFTCRCYDSRVGPFHFNGDSGTKNFPCHKSK